MEINSNHSTYGAAFRQKPIFFMSGKETVAFFEGKLKKNMTLQEDSCTLGSNDTYRRQHSGTFTVHTAGKMKIGGNTSTNIMKS